MPNTKRRVNTRRKSSPGTAPKTPPPAVAAPPAPPTLLQRIPIALAIVLLTAAGLRLVGLGWGLPNVLHSFSYHPDESVVLMHSLPAFGGLDIAHGGFVPHFYNYGTLQLILIAFACVIGKGYHLIGPIIGATGAIDPKAFAHAYFAARLVTVAMGVGAVWATYAIGRRLWGHSVGLAAALALTILPLHVQHSHFATVDVPATFWVVLSILWASKCVEAAKTGGFRGVLPWLLSGVFAGLAAATKYNCALVILSLLAAGHIVAWAPGPDKGPAQVKSALWRTLAGLVAALAAFAAGCPGAIADRAKFLADVHFEQVHVYEHPELYFQHTGPGFWYIIVHNMPVSVGGWPMLGAMLGGVACALFLRSRGDGIIGVFALAYFLLISLAASRYARYEIPLLPVLALWAARLLSLGVDHKRTIALAVMNACVALSALGVATTIMPMVGIDIRDRIAESVLSHAPAPSVGLASTPWFWTPPFNPDFTYPQPWGWVKFPQETRTPVSLVINPPDKPFDVEALERSKPDLVVLSELEYHDRLRLHDPAARAYVHYLTANYRVDRTSAKRTVGLLTAQIDDLPVSDAPVDMLYTDPITLVFYRRLPTQPR
ncbi:MAG: glycosyltransferase family 39 protein [Capsulimonadaceae bacterium]|nr:glycosyltransferase family 39 protein [Capsulimonadaceae bacterium]